MSAAERIYRLLLRAYPAPFRERFEREMLLAFRDLRREGDASGPWFWGEMLGDIARSALTLRGEELRARMANVIAPRRRVMKTMGILAVVIGTFELVTAAAEGWHGGILGGDGAPLGAGALGLVAGLALIAAGVALARRAPRRVSWAGWGAALCVLSIGVERLAVPRLSIAATAAGIAFPVALLLFLRFGRSRTVPPAAAALALLVLSLPGCARAQTQGQPPAPAVAPAPKDLPLTAAERQAFVGAYAVTLPGGMQTTLRVFEENGVLRARPDNEDDAPRMLYQGNDIFFFESVPNFSLTFTVENGRATKFAVRKEDGFGEGVRIP